MEIFSLEDSYEEARRKVKAFYSEIKSVPCPALDGEMIIFNRMGFQHLVWKGRKQRSKDEQRARFALLPYVKEMISDPNIVVTKREQKATFWALAKRQNNVEIRLIIRQRKGGNKHFFSIFSVDDKKSPL